MIIRTETPQRYKNASLKSCEQNDITHIVSDLFSIEAYKNGRSKSCLVLAGVPGCGKSFACWALKNDMSQLPDGEFKIIESGEHVFSVNHRKRFVTVIDASFFTEIQFCAFAEKDEAMERVKGADVLCIDDLGMEAQNEKNISLLEIVINERYNEERTTIITTNLSLEELKKRYSERVIDRLREWGIFFESKMDSRRRALKAVS